MNVMKKKLVYIFIFSMLCGCGYRFAGEEGILGGRVKSISVTVFQNKSRWADLDVIATNYMIEAIRRSRSVQLTQSNGSYCFSGTIERVKVDTLSRSADGASQEKYVEITISTYLTDGHGKKTWQSASMTEREPYFPANNIQDIKAAQKAAFSSALQRLADMTMGTLGQGF